MSVPTVTSGNPYTAYLAALDDTLYQSPPAAFYYRVIVLMTICAYGMLISVVYWNSLRAQYSSSQEEETFGGRPLPKAWTLRAKDGYWTLNSHAVVPWGGCFACACMLVYTYAEYLVLAKHQYMGAINTFRSFVWLSVTLEGWLVTACSLGAYVVVARKSERMNRSSGGWSFIPPPRVFNACFVFVTVAMAGSMIGSDIAFAVSWSQAWRAICTLRHRLVNYESTWTGAMNVTQLLDLNELKANVETQVAQNLPFQHAMVVSLIVCAFLIALLNIGSVALVLLLRRQIRASLARRSNISVFALQAQPPEKLTFNKRDIPLPVHSPHLAPVDPLDPNPPPQRPSLPSAQSSPEKYVLDLHGGPETPLEEHDQPFIARLGLPVLAKLGSRKSSEAMLAVTSPDGAAGWGAWREKWSPGGLKARLAPNSPALPIDLGGRDTLLDLKRAERDLLICVSVVIAMGLMFGAENVWNLVYVLPNDVSWPAVEFSYFFCPWAFSIIYSTGCTFLVLNSLIATRRHRRRERAMSLSNDRRPSAMPHDEGGVGAVGLDTFLGAGPEAGHRDSANVGMGIEFGEVEEEGRGDLEAGGGFVPGSGFLTVEGSEPSRTRRPPVIRFPSVERKEGEKWNDGSP